MTMYKTREIKFNSIVEVEGWKIKVYTISKNQQFEGNITLTAAINKFPEWLNKTNGFDDSNDKIGFLICHSGTEGVFSILNWWVGKNMLNTHIFFSEYSRPQEFKRISGEGLAPCIWELEVINRERNSWIEHILKQPENPNYNAYLNDTFNTIL